MNPYPPSDEWNCSTFLGPFSQFSGPFVDTANGCSNPIMGASGMIHEYPMQGLSTELDESDNSYNFGGHFLPNVGSWQNGAHQTSIDPSDMSNEAESQRSFPGFMHDNVDGLSLMGNFSTAIDKHPSMAGKRHSEVDGLSTNIEGLSDTVETLSSTVNGMSSAIENLSVKVVSTSLALDSLNEKTDQIANTIGNLSETVDEIVKRERIAMDKFGKFPRKAGRPSPVVFQSS